MKVTAIFLNGAAVSAPGWSELEDTLMDDAWNPSRPAAFRREMRLRARNWSSTEVKKEGESQAFLQRLESAGLFRIEVDNDSAS